MRAEGAIVLFFFIILIVIFIQLPKKEVVYVKSNVDGQTYLVRDLPDKQQAADMLAEIKANIMKLVTYLDQNKTTKFKDYDKYITQLSNRINQVVITESTEDSIYTSYSVNKGEQIVFCLRSRNNNNQLHPINLVMYVALHEISHVACPEYGHGALFKKIFAFITVEAIGQGIYTKIPFNSNPTEYCGLTITDSII